MNPPRTRTAAADGDGDNAKAQLSFDVSRRPVADSATVPTSPAEVRAAPVPPAESGPRIFGVAEIVRFARQAIEARFTDVHVEGELSGLKRSVAGHLYFTLKDRSAQLDCAMFSREASRLAVQPADGMLVRCRGRLTIFEARGKFQLAVSAIELAGAGALALAFEELKRRLTAEGLFDAGRKRKLPFLPRRIGVVTSPTGAVIRDIINVVHRRFPVPILLAPTPVQGEGAAAQIARALQNLGEIPDVDVIILARGGGSLQDLWAFNDEALARAIARAPVPVISAVGHETDFTIADFIADVRAPTPSAAAELVVPVADDLLAEVAVCARRLHRGTESELRACRLRLERTRSALGDPRRRIDERRQELDDGAHRAAQAVRRRLTATRATLRTAEAQLMRAHPRRRIHAQRTAMGDLLHRLTRAGSSLFTTRRSALETLGGKLNAMSPLRVLDRGYALARGPEGHLVTRASALHEGDTLTVTLREGELDAVVRASRSEPRSAKK